MAVPKYYELFNPLIKALHALGGSSSVQEMGEKVAELLNLPEEDVNEIHKGNTTKLNYRLAWARNYLKNYGILENSARGIWSFTVKGSKIHQVDEKVVVDHVRNLSKRTSTIDDAVDDGSVPDSSEKIWTDELSEILLQLSPDSFEKLCQRILRESGFSQVNVTGRSGDGGIDGEGIFKLGGLLSISVVFQCKRYKDSVSSKEIRNFRGAMTGRTDKGLFITTGTFTRGAKEEASRDGTFRIDLVDGEAIMEKMKELRLGIDVKMEEDVSIDRKWFAAFE